MTLGSGFTDAPARSDDVLFYASPPGAELLGELEPHIFPIDTLTGCSSTVGMGPRRCGHCLTFVALVGAVS